MRRRFQFNLRALFCVTTGAAGAAASLLWFSHSPRAGATVAEWAFPLFVSALAGLVACGAGSLVWGITSKMPRLQFSLRTMLWLVTAAAIASLLLTAELRRRSDEEAKAREAETFHRKMHFSDPIQNAD